MRTDSPSYKYLRVTPMMQAGISKTVWDMDDLVQIMDECAPKPSPPGPYERRGEIWN